MENTAEKPSGNKATIVKNTTQLSRIPHHMLSTVPYQIITQQAENTTTTWPVIPTTLRSKRRKLQQANAENTTENTTENTAEKPSGNKATIVKNTAQLSKIPHHILSTVLHQIITQQAENTTATWPIIPTALI
ncbi:hypothetical protein HO133_006249 [Letharia lupina]|uniref:Uncharacterized protein n=1 Tax=Letharia lupina TaxID=560253 RepID=A0A8H6C6R8_9LECA|nr:uncharacterized protein HO133_006249 [Letharia lupina]KAF6217838.1 hypothetical protein HO133_006249 [Letharia lupina]